MAIDGAVGVLLLRRVLNRMRAMLLIWGTILVSGIVYFTIVGISHG